MKKLLIGITVIIVLLSSCAGNTQKVPVTESQNETAATTSYPAYDVVVTGSTDGTANTVPDETADITSTEAAPVNSTITASGMPNKSFIGVWSTDEAGTNQILIYEITEDTIKFNSGLIGQFGFEATGKLLNGKIVFGDGVTPDYSGAEGISGRLEFSDNGVTVIYDDFGSLEFPENYPNKYIFPIKDKDSDMIVSQYKATLPD